tara:strand:- start:7402 stop:9399 length:1998 start_codon:yes stop_codon:yes gene_type:complete
MISLTSIDQSWTHHDFFKWVLAYKESMPKGDRILIALDDPFHQLAALYASLCHPITALSSNHENLKIHYDIFRPDAIVDKILETSNLDSDTSSLALKGNLGIATSGSSGRPKVVVLSTHALMASAKASCDFYKLSSQDIIASPLPLHHIGGVMPFWRALESKCKLILPKKHWLQACEFKATQISLVPTQLKTLLDQDYDWSSYKSVILGAQALDPKLFNRALKAGCPISVSYGSSESAAQLSATHPKQDPHGGVGHLLAGRDVKIIEGKIAFKGPAVFTHYIDQGDVHLPFNDDGYFLTNDLGSLSTNNLLSIHGRSDHVFKCGGENINPTKLETTLLANKSLTECIVVPLPDEHFGNVCSAAITPFNQESIKSIIDTNSDLLPHERIKFLGQLKNFGQSVKHSRSKEETTISQKFKNWNLQRLGPKLDGKDNLVFLHGFMGAGSHMKDLATSFSTEFNVWSIDLPFHGMNISNDEVLNWDQIIDSLAAILLRFNNLWIYGYSMGGRLVYGLLDRYPDLIKFAIAESAHPGLNTDEDRNSRKNFENNIISAMSDNDFASFLTNWYKADLFSLNDSEIAMLIDQTASTPKLYAKALSSYGLSAQPNLQHILKSPKLITVCGELDKKYRSLLPGSIIIAKSSHKASFQAPNELYRQLIEYFKIQNWN